MGFPRRTAPRWIGCLQVCGPPSRAGLESPPATHVARDGPLAVPRRRYSHPRPVRIRRFGSAGTKMGRQRTRSYVSRVLKPDAWFLFPRRARPVSRMGGHSNRQFRAIGCRRGRSLRTDAIRDAGNTQKRCPQDVYGAYPTTEVVGFAPVQYYKRITSAVTRPVSNYVTPAKREAFNWHPNPSSSGATVLASRGRRPWYPMIPDSHGRRFIRVSRAPSDRRVRSRGTPKPPRHISRRSSPLGSGAVN